MADTSLTERRKLRRLHHFLNLLDGVDVGTRPETDADFIMLSAPSSLLQK